MRRLVGLGGDCQVAHHIKRVSPDYEKHFFDWLIIPANTVLMLLDNGFTSIVQEEDLVPDFYEGRLQKVVDVRNNTWLVHDIPEFNHENILQAQEKYAYLGQKFLKMLNDGQPTTFVRRWHSIDGPEDEAVARQILIGLQRYKSDAELIYLHQDTARAPLIDGCYRSAYIPQVPGTWVGDEDAWTDILTRFSTENLCVEDNKLRHKSEERITAND